MKCRRAMLLAVLLYVTLDLLVPAMPGAFVFESAESVEISSGRAGESKAGISLLPALASASFGVSQSPVSVRDRLATARRDALLGHPILSPLPRATLDPAPPSEDPQ